MDTTRLRLTLVIPIFNEEKNIAPLIAILRENRREPYFCPHELILVNNGSQDGSAEELKKIPPEGWIKVITLKENVGYGGGIQEGFRSSSPTSTHLGWIPADLQYSVEDLLKVWAKVHEEPNALHKGWRTKRYDGSQTKIVSRIYTKLYRWILGIHIVDVNGLPKILPVGLFQNVDFTLSNNFVMDGQWCLAAELFCIPVREHPVTFYARRSGVSSWSSKRIKIYRETILELFRMRKSSESWFTTEIRKDRDGISASL